MKYYGAVGYAETTQTTPGVWKEQIVDRYYYGDIIQVHRRLDSSQQINDDVSVSNKISIVADPYAVDNFLNIRYITWLGKKWKVSEVSVETPRLVFSLGGLYNDSD